MSGLRGAPAPSPPLPGDPGAGAPHRVSAAAARCAERLVLARSLALLGVLAAASPAGAQTAVSVDDNGLWRVDLRSHTAELLAPLDNPEVGFSCGDLAVSPAGLIRCTFGDRLYAIEPTSGEVSPLEGPAGTYPGGLEFDADERLWYVGLTGGDLMQLDPATGAVLRSQPLSLVGGTYRFALAALGDRLFAVTGEPSSEPLTIEEIDLATGTSLSAVEVLGGGSPIDAAFDDRGDVWLTEYTGSIILGLDCFRYRRIALVRFEVETTWEGCVFTPAHPAFASIAEVLDASALEVPALGRAGGVLLVAALLLSALLVLRRSAA